MKLKTSFATLAVALVTFTASAGNRAYDGFEDYAVGTVLGNKSPNGGSGFLDGYVGQYGTSPNASTIVENGLVYQAGTLRVDGGNRRLHCTKLTKYDNTFRRKTQTYNTDAFYFSFLIRTSPETVAGSDADTLAVGFHTSDAYPPHGVLMNGTSTKYFSSRLLNVNGSASSVPFAGDTTYFVVCKLEKTQKNVIDRYNKVSVLVNPTSDVEPSSWTIVNEYTGTGNPSGNALWNSASLNWLNFGVLLSTQEDEDWYDLDEIRIGTAWSDVVINDLKIPPAVWQGGGATKDWSVADNWIDGASPSGADVGFCTLDLTDENTVNNVVSADTTVKSLTYTNGVLSSASPQWHVTEIAEGKTLSVTGSDEAGNVLNMTGVGGFSDANHIVNAKFTGGGNLKIKSDGDVNLVYNGYGKVGIVRLDAGGLASLDFDINTLMMGKGESTYGKFWCAATGVASNVIRAAYIGVGDSRSGKRYPGTSELYLGKLNWIYTDALSVGATIGSFGNWSSGKVQFTDGLSNPTLVLRGRDRVSRTDLRIGCHAGATDTYWYNVTGTFDASAGSIDLLVNEMMLGDGRGYWDPSNQRGECNGIFKMAAGQVDANRLTLGRSLYTGGSKSTRSYPAYGSVQISGGTFKVNEFVSIANNDTNVISKTTYGGRQRVKGELLLTGGEFIAEGPIEIAKRAGQATTVVARVSIESARLTALAGLRTGYLNLETGAPLVTLDASVEVLPNGILAVTNATQDSELFLDHATLKLAGGTALADRLTMTNALSVVHFAPPTLAAEPGITVAGAVKLGGTFRASLPSGVARLPSGKFWTVASGNSVEGKFDSLDVPAGTTVKYRSQGVYFGRFSDGLMILVH